LRIFRLLFLSSAIGLVSPASPARADNGAQDETALRRAVMEARRTLEAEKRRIASDLERERARAETARRDLAAVVSATASAQTALDDLRAEIARARAAIEKEEEEAPATEALSAEIRALARDVSIRLVARSEQLLPLACFAAARREAAELAQALDSASIREIPARIARAIAIAEGLIEKAAEIEASCEPVRASDGVEREARLLRLGALGALCETKDGTRREILLRGPDGEGYAWQDPRSRTVDAGIKRAIERAFRGESPLEIPLDPTSEIRADRVSGEQGTFAYLAKGAPALLPIGALGLAAALLALKKALALRRERRRIDLLLAELLPAATARDFCRLSASLAFGGALAAIAKAGIERAHMGAEIAEEAMQLEAAASTPEIERGLGTLALLGSLAPMLGLLGTVMGLIATFHAISGRNPGDAHALAAGIAEALVATAGGLLVAIPTVLVHHLLANRADSLLADMERGADAVAEAIRAGAAQAGKEPT
jgi:biopolymer transport protein ExbB